jgi:hypothetical protein
MCPYSERSRQRFAQHLSRWILWSVYQNPRGGSLSLIMRRRPFTSAAVLIGPIGYGHVGLSIVLKFVCVIVWNSLRSGFRNRVLVLRPTSWPTVHTGTSRWKLLNLCKKKSTNNIFTCKYWFKKLFLFLFIYIYIYFIFIEALTFIIVFNIIFCMLLPLTKFWKKFTQICIPTS